VTNISQDDSNFLIEYIEQMFILARAGQTQGLIFWGAFYTFAICLYSVIYQTRIYRWPSVIGKLLELGTKESGPGQRVKSDQMYVSKALYSYSVNGKDYQGTRVSSWVIAASHNARTFLEAQLKSVDQRGGSVTVFYNPGNPQKSFLIKPGLAGQLFTFAIGCSPSLYYFANYLL